MFVPEPAKMKDRKNLYRWMPRIGALAFSAFISLFVQDAFSHPGTSAVGIIMHLLPVLFCLLVVLFAWQREWIGALAFGTIFFIYAWQSLEHPWWIAAIGGPLLILTVLYGLAWRVRRAGP